LPLALTEVLGREGAAAARRMQALDEHEELLTYLVRDRAGKVLLQSHDADPELFEPRPAVGFRSTGTHRIYGEAAVNASIVIEVADPLVHRRDAAEEAVASLLLPLLVLVPVALFGAWWFVRRSMRPVLAFEAQIARRGAGDLAPVCGRRLPAELAPVAAAVNALLERLRRALEAERSFTANSAHELRTPIAATLAHAQRLVAESPAGPLRERAQQVEAALRRLARLAEKLMQLAQAEGGALLLHEARDLLPVVAHVVEEFSRDTASGTRLRLAPPETAALYSHLDADAFAILMRNLIENALRHGDADAAVDVSVSADGAIHVVNDGAVVSPETLRRLKARFERGGASAAGAGLGLAIAEAIASGAGGTLELRSPITGRAGGFEAIVRLP
jgi:two-component system OmpR family sensor kinase